MLKPAPPILSSSTGTGLTVSLLEAWSVETRMAALLQEQGDQSRNAEACRIYYDHLEVTRDQARRLEEALQAAGIAPQLTSGGYFSGLCSLGASRLLVGDLLQKEAQGLRAAYVRAQLECDMYRALQARASSLRENGILVLATELLLEEEAYVRRLWPYLGLLTELASRPDARRDRPAVRG